MIDTLQIMKTFTKENLKALYKPDWESNGEDNGQVTIIGGSSLFHGAPILALKAASRIVDMVFFSSPEPIVGRVAEQIKSKLMSFIWAPWEEIDSYIEKSDAVLIGPGMMRYGSEDNKDTESCDEECDKTKLITQRLLEKFPNKRWVIDAGSLQTMDESWIPKNAIITPNRKEFEMLFGVKDHSADIVQKKAGEHNCVIVAKGPQTIIASPDECVLIKGGNPGLTKGGSGDTLAGLTAALLAKNDSFLAACSASVILKAAADDLYEKVGINYNMDDLTNQIPETFSKLI